MDNISTETDEYEFTVEFELPPGSSSNSVTDENVDELDLSQSTSTVTDNSIGDNPYNSESNYSDNDDDDYYEIEEVNNNFHHNLPTYDIDNMDLNVHETDSSKGWIREDNDSGSSCGPFLSSSSTNIDLTNPKPELFFNELFDERMWTIIAEASNEYARSKSRNVEGK